MAVGASPKVADAQPGSHIVLADQTTAGVATVAHQQSRLLAIFICTVWVRLSKTVQ
jgi:hypothetical protein